MKKNIHPEYGKCVIKCVCGNEIITKSTLRTINVEICGACHPVYTKEKKIIDSAGRVEKFERMMKRKKDGVRSKREKRIERSKRKAKGN